jgi:CheY-like chemotaxis protein
VLVYSSPSQGTSFKILLPIADGRVEEERGTVDWIDVAGHETILVAEDEPEVRRFVTRVLTGHGYTVLEASNGREALQIATSHAGPIDLLLSDVVMPELGGLELAEAVRKLHPSTRVAHMSGYSQRVLGPESDQVIEKPFTASSLVRHVREVLNYRGREDT